MPVTKSFHGYFKESMDSVGLPSPDTLFGSITTASTSIQALLTIVQTYGTKVTIAEIVLTEAGAILTGVAVTKVVGAITVAFYVGACIGALAYASGQYSADTLWASQQPRIGDFVNLAKRQGISIPESMYPVLAHNERIRRMVA
jgi:hypothetical protein